MAVNPLGYQNITDGGAPRIITGYANEVISGGQLVGAYSLTGVVSSGVDSFATSDIVLNHSAGSGNFVGIALHDAASGAPLSFATRGEFILGVSGTAVAAGALVGCNDGDEVIAGSAAAALNNIIGRTWTAGSAGGYAIVDIHG